MTEIVWRPYQNQCAAAVKLEYDNGIRKQLIVQATGTGKRLAAVALMQHFKRSLFIVHREELLMQAYQEIEKYFPMNVGIIKGKIFEADKKVVVASVQTLYNRLDKMDPTGFNFIVVDEAHHYCSVSYLKTVRHFKPKLLTGWTATPKRLDGLSLTNIFEKIVFQYNIEDGIRDGYLAPIEAYQIKTITDISKVKKTAGDFNQKQLSEAVDSELRNNLIVQKYKQYTPGRPTIAYCVDIEHAYHLRDEFRKNNISCEAVSSDESRGDDRTEIVKKFRNKEFTVLTNCEILTEGFDFNDVGCVIMARPTQSETLYVQCIGRATRLKSGPFIEEFKTDKATILDFVDNTGKLNLINAYELEKDKPIEDRLFLPKENRDKLLEEQNKRRERKITQEAGKDRKIDLLKLPEIRVWDSAKMLDPATEKQLEWLKSSGVWTEGVEYTKKQASELISNLPCQEWQIRYLAVHGYDVTHGASMGQYQRVKANVENKQKFAMDNKQKNNVLNKLTKKSWET
jgi:superfamily II DNA or RNA helicase